MSAHVMSSLEDFGRQLRQHLYGCSRQTSGVGAGPTKPIENISPVVLKGVEIVSCVLALIRGNPHRTQKLI